MVKTKTFWAAVTACVGAIGAYMTEELEAGAALQVVVTSLLAVFLRQGVMKGEVAAAAATEAAVTAAKAAAQASKPSYDYTYDYTYRG